MTPDNVGGASGALVYSRSIWVAGMIALMLSWGMMNIIARVIEGRWLIPSEQYRGFYFGDLICLPVIIMGLTLLNQQEVHGSWFRQTWWHVACLVVGIAGGAYVHWIQDASAYTSGQLSSPTKLYHDLVVYPIYMYLLLSAMPLLWSVGWNATQILADIGIGALLGAFMMMNAYDGTHRAIGAHIDFTYHTGLLWWPVVGMILLLGWFFSSYLRT